ncbi:synaptotagmin-like protein 4 [Dysidea avara]|uniref:synaptotagmin-like protein 4 n=1 Tax=Dysidea avara TaxID=196820 RepID=UPI003317E968
MSQIVQLSFLSEKEEEAILSVIEEDLKLQKEEERRIQKLRDDIIASLTLKCRRSHARTICACCGVLFGWIFDSGKMCPTCSQWICKRDQIHRSDNNQWICKLCNVRMELHINEKMLDVSLDPFSMLCVSFNTRDGEMEQQFHCKQQNYLLQKEETGQDYQNPEMFQQLETTGKESEEKRKDNGDTANFVAFFNSNTQETCQQNCQHSQKKEGAEQQQQQQQMQPVTCTYSQSPKKLTFKEKPNIKIITQSFLAIMNPVDTLDDDNDHGVTEITTDNEDSSSSSEDYSETSDDDDQEKNTSNQPKPILVYPSSNHDGGETINLMFPQECEIKASFELDDDDFRALTKQNTLRNRVNVTSSLRSLTRHDTSRLTDCGQLKVSLQFNITNDKKQMGDLVVTIIGGHNLLQTESTCNPVVKCHLLPDHKKKFKTKVLKDSSDPEWNEQFVFDHLKLEDLSKNRVIELTVWNSTNTKHYYFIGGLRLGPPPNHKKQLSYMDSSENELSHWMSVVNTPGQCVEQLHILRHSMDPLPMGVTSQQEVTVQNSFKTVTKTPPSGGSDSDNTSMVVYSSRQLVDTPVHIGELRVMLQFVPEIADKSGKLKVWIRQASRLKTRYDNGSFVVCTLLPKGKHQKLKSPLVIHNDENSLYNAKFQFDEVTEVKLSYDRVLEISIWEPHHNTNEFVGGVRLGPKPHAGNKNKWMDSVGNEVSQWEMMMTRPKEWIDEWHPLRLVNKPQKV